MMLLTLSPDWVGAIATAVGAVGTIISLIFLYSQLRDIKSSVRSSTYLNLYEQMIEIDKFFFDHPELRPYFYEGKPGGDNMRDEKAANRLNSVAEMMIDFFDMAYHQRDCMPPGTVAGFENYMKRIYRSSPVMKDFIGLYSASYPDKFICDLTGGQLPPRLLGE
jgi:hypothetical protein